MSTPISMDREITVKLTMAQALILSDCVERIANDERIAPLIDKSEQAALWALDCVLEAWNPVIFSRDYAAHLQEAKSHITRGMDL